MLEKIIQCESYIGIFWQVRNDHIIWIFLFSVEFIALGTSLSVSELMNYSNYLCSIYSGDMESKTIDR